ncbi:pyridoxamine 5'-phosphate oxidase family protein [Microbulbifer agarilyticus]|uniref:HugZ family pyridoxamine 5'-phosphate oxidase n=1 Tax=Microbulbifer agarilyticus TaxID=260552 RepID=UPI001C9763F5|nr:pyridoxamine 5'-phosphate oxidase family protein [Microbulbifer agarilyticus]MBY6190258.1 pyridoxamine 5'-phosphate oxidase family protein [Microbulbifer agarilyticus]
MTEQNNQAPKTDEGADLVAEVRDFIATRKLLNLASLADDGQPHASTAPFLAADGNFYLYVSDLSEHAANLKANSNASVIFNADEADTKQAFARLRVTFNVAASMIERGGEAFQNRIEQLREKFGPVMDHLKDLEDFNLFELKPSAGRYVKGFGRAYALEGLEKQVALHLKDGHKEKKSDAA